MRNTKLNPASKPYDKETIYWLKLTEDRILEEEKERQRLILEAIELMNIFGSILRKADEQK